jgi:hypothetical protein
MSSGEGYLFQGIIGTMSQCAPLVLLGVREGKSPRFSFLASRHFRYWWQHAWHVELSRAAVTADVLICDGTQLLTFLRLRGDGVCGDWACSPMVGRSRGTLPTSVQILVLAPFPGFSKIYRALCVKS